MKALFWAQKRPAIGLHLGLHSAYTRPTLGAHSAYTRP